MAQISERYADALFKISQEKDTLRSDLEQAIFVRDTLNNDDVQDYLVHPNIPDSAKQELFQNAYSEKISKHLMGFLYLMVRKNREAVIVAALTKYIENANRYFGRIEARVVSAKPFTEKQIESIHKILSEQLDMFVDIKAEVDPDVIGGFYILVEGHIFDGTVRSQLNKLKNRFYKGNIVAKVVSAKPLSEEQIESISNILSKKIDMKVRVKTEVDPNVIGGFYVLVDGRVFDGTVRSELKNLKKRLKRGNINVK